MDGWEGSGWPGDSAYADYALECATLVKARRDISAFRCDVDIGNARGGRPLPAVPDHRIDHITRPGKCHFNAAVAAVSDPTVQTGRLRRLHGPGPIPNPLNAPFDAQPHRLFLHGNRFKPPSGLPQPSNSRITCSAVKLSPGAAFTAAITPSRSARRTFSIFIASTTAKGCPALISSPSAT